MTTDISSFEAHSQIVRDNQKRIKFWQRTEASREHFHVGIWVDGVAAVGSQVLNQVKQVDYELHPSFRRRVRSSQNRDNKFGITIWTWGLFNVHITLFMIDGSKLEMDYFLDYDLPPDDGANYVQVDAPTSTTLWEPPR